MRVIFKTQKMSSLDHKNKHTHTHTTQTNETKHTNTIKYKNSIIHTARQIKQ